MTTKYRSLIKALFFITTALAAEETQQPTAAVNQQPAPQEEPRSKKDIQEIATFKEQLIGVYYAHFLSAVDEFQQTVNSTPNKLGKALHAEDERREKQIEASEQDTYWNSGKNFLSKALYQTVPQNVVVEEVSKYDLVEQRCTDISKRLDSLLNEARKKYGNRKLTMQDIEHLELSLHGLKVYFSDGLADKLPIDQFLRKPLTDGELQKQVETLSGEFNKLSKQAAVEQIKKNKRVSSRKKKTTLPEITELQERLNLMKNSASLVNVQINAYLENYERGWLNRAAKWAFVPIATVYYQAKHDPFLSLMVFAGTVTGVGGIAAYTLGGPSGLLTAMGVMAGKAAGGIKLGIVTKVGHSICDWAWGRLRKASDDAATVGIHTLKKTAKIESPYDHFVGVLGGVMVTNKLPENPEAEKYLPNQACQEIIGTFHMMADQILANKATHQFANTNKAWLFYGEPGVGKTSSVDYILHTIAKMGVPVYYIDLSNNPETLKDNNILVEAIGAAQKLGALCVINFGEALAYAKLSQRDAPDATNNLLIGFEKLYKESVGVIAIATHNKKEFPADVARIQRMNIVHVYNPDWDERREFFEQYYKTTGNGSSLTAQDLNYFATLTEQANRAQIGAILHTALNVHKTTGRPLDRMTMETIILTTLHTIAEKQPEVDQATAAHRAGQVLAHLQGVEYPLTRQGSHALFASPLIFTEKESGDTVKHKETPGIFFYATHSAFKQEESPTVRIKRLIAGAKAQELLMNSVHYHNHALKKQDLTAALDECAKIAEADQPFLDKRQMIKERNKIYEKLEKEVVDDLKREEALLKALKNHLVNYGSINTELFFMIRSQLAKGGAHQATARLPVPMPFPHQQRSQDEPPNPVKLIAQQRQQQQKASSATTAAGG